MSVADDAGLVELITAYTMSTEGNAVRIIADVTGVGQGNGADVVQVSLDGVFHRPGGGGDVVARTQVSSVNTAGAAGTDSPTWTASFVIDTYDILIKVQSAGASNQDVVYHADWRAKELPGGTGISS